MKTPYLKTIKIQCPTKTLRQYNGGDLHDTVLDLQAYFHRALHNNGIEYKGPFHIQFTTQEGTFPTSANRLGELLDITVEVSAPGFRKEVLEKELELVGMREGFVFLEERYGAFVPIG